MTASILIDGHNLTRPNATGIGTYARELAAVARRIGCEPQLLMSGNSRIDPNDPQTSEVLLFDAALNRRQPARIRREKMRAWLIGKPFGIRATRFARAGAVVPGPGDPLAQFGAIQVAPNLFDLAIHHFRRHQRRAVVRLDAAPSLFHASFPTPLAVRGCPNIYTLHDIVPLRMPQATLDDKKLMVRLLRNLCRNADHIVTVSEFSRRDIIDFFGIAEDRITNTYQSVSLPKALAEKSEADVEREISAAFGVSMRDYFLFVGAIEPKKNVARMIDAYAASGSARPLLIVGGLGWQYDADVEKMAEERFLSYAMRDGHIAPERRVRRIPYLPLSQLVALMRGARGVLFPSLYEGFGLPVLEAMLLGTPVITSNVSSLPEIAGDAAMLVDPTDIDDIAKAIRSLDHDGDLRDELTARGLKRAALFSPAAYDARIAALYEKLGVAVPEPPAA